MCLWTSIIVICYSVSHVYSFFYFFLFLGEGERRIKEDHISKREYSKEKKGRKAAHTYTHAHSHIGHLLDLVGLYDVCVQVWMCGCCFDASLASFLFPWGEEGRRGRKEGGRGLREGGVPF